MHTLPTCPTCNSTYTYKDAELFICPECSHEWTSNEEETAGVRSEIKDANGKIEGIGPMKLKSQFVKNV